MYVLFVETIIVFLRTFPCSHCLLSSLGLDYVQFLYIPVNQYDRSGWIMILCAKIDIGYVVFRNICLFLNSALPSTAPALQ